MLRDTSNSNGGFWGKNGEDFGLRLGSTSWFFPGNANDFHYVTGGGLVAINGVVSNSVTAVGQPHLVTSVSGSRQTFKPAIGDYWGSSSYPDRYYRGEVAEILAYDRRLTDVERQTVEAALMSKWFSAAIGSVLPASATVSVAAGATLDLAGSAVTIASLSGGGSVSNGALTVTGAVVPDGALKFSESPSLTGTLTLDIEGDVCDSLAVADSIDVSGLSLVLNLPETAPPITSYALISASGNVLGPFESASIPRPWVLVYKPAAIRLIYCAGTLMSIR